MYTKMDRKTRQHVQELDEDKFIENFANATVKNWKGLRVKDLEQLLLVDIGDEDPEKEIPYTPEDAIELIKNSAEFDGWLNDAVFDLDNFRSVGDRGTVEQTGNLAKESTRQDNKREVSKSV